MKANKRNLQTQVNETRNAVERHAKHLAHILHMMSLAQKVTGRDSVEACALASLSLSYLSTRHYQVKSELAENEFVLACLLQLQLDGKCYVASWSRDCDLCSSSSVRQYNSVAAALVARESAYQNAEGPVSFRPITREEFDARKGHDETRDLAAEMAGY